MASEQKTLIVFDTNKLRSTSDGGLSYGSFDFSSEFNEIKSFIEKKGLSDFIHIGVPRLAIDELLKQKIEQYSKDIDDISKIENRLSGIPETDFSNVSLPDTNFDCKNHLKPLMEKFTQDNGIIIIDILEDKLGYIFKEIMRRAIEREPPFRQSKKSSDAGFKDTVIWEALLNYENLDDYDKVIFVSRDSDFNENCIEEFKSKAKKHFSISPSGGFVIKEIETDYQPLIERKEWSNFVDTDYFKDHISTFLSGVDKIPIDDNEYALEKREIINYIDSIEHLEEEETGISTIIISLVKSTVKIDNNEKEVFLKVKTYLDDTRGIQDAELEVVKNEGN